MTLNCWCFTSEFCQPNLDSIQKQKVWELLSFYLENLSDVLDQNSQLNLSQHKLIGNGHKIIHHIIHQHNSLSDEHTCHMNSMV